MLLKACISCIQVYNFQMHLDQSGISRSIWSIWFGSLHPPIQPDSFPSSKSCTDTRLINYTKIHFMCVLFLIFYGEIHNLYVSTKCNLIFP
jgi:hypothetical protein